MKGLFQLRFLCLIFSGVSALFAYTLCAENFDTMGAPLVPYKRYSAPTLVEMKDGRILLAYNEWTKLGELRDLSPANIAARFSTDGGRNWGRPFVLQENTSRVGRMGPPTLLRLQNGELGFFYSQLDSHSDDKWFFKSSSDQGETWTEPVRITKEPAYYVMNNHRVIQLASGRLLAPFSYVPDLARRDQFSWKGVCYYSDDSGKTWTRGSATVELPKYPTGVQEPGLIELKDGSVMMIIRNAHERVYKAFSHDQGETWSEPEPIEQLIAPVSPATIMRIPQTKDLAIVWNYSPQVRTPLAIAISRDEGETWENTRYLETDYFSYAYTAFLFPSNSEQLLLCYWVHRPVRRWQGWHQHDEPQGIGLRVRGIDIDWLYRAPDVRSYKPAHRR